MGITTTLEIKQNLFQNKYAWINNNYVIITINCHNFHNLLINIIIKTWLYDVYYLKNANADVITNAINRSDFENYISGNGTVHVRAQQKIHDVRLYLEAINVHKHDVWSKQVKRQKVEEFTSCHYGWVHYNKCENISHLS